MFCVVRKYMKWLVEHICHHLLALNKCQYHQSVALYKTLN